MEREILKTIVLDQREYFSGGDIVSRTNRNQAFLGKNKEIIVISGIRRCGKSTLLHEIRNLNAESDYFLNFDDDRLIQFSVKDFQLLLEIFLELFGEQSFFYFDEIQNIPGWERFVRRLYDQRKKVFITGSNASMLSRELGTHLTGRYLQYELFPFSFREFLALNKVGFTEKDLVTTSGRTMLKRWFNDYFLRGGFPEYLKNNNREYLKSLYESILYRDVMVRNKITNEKEILELVYYLASNIGKLVSFNRLKNTIGVRHAVTVKNYLNFLENAYLVFLVNKYDPSLKIQMQNPKKVYFIDNTLSRELGFHTSADKGRFLENLVFLELRRNGRNVYYHKQKHECDFVIREKNKIVAAIQVCWSLEVENTRQREVAGLVEAMERYGLTEGMIFTESEEETITLKQLKIRVVPVYKWLLQEGAKRQS